jgi:hypothetical protein
MKHLWRVAAAIPIIALAACARATPAPPTPVTSGPSDLSVAVASDDFPTGEPRVPFVLFRGSQPIADAQAVTMTAFDLSSGTAVPGWSGTATGYNDYDIPYWVVYPALPHAGYWGLGVTVTLADGTQLPGQFTVEALADPAAPVIGESVPASQNRTLKSEPDLKKLTSDASPEPGLYQLTVAEAIASGRPTVVTFATPAFCQSRLCAPVVDSVKQVYQAHQDAVNFIHIEVYKSFDPLVYADEMDQWHLSSEPWTFVLDREGKVAARLGGPVSPRELNEALKPVLNP